MRSLLAFPPIALAARRSASRSLAGRVVVIVGASSGIGRATAVSLAEHRCRLVLAARSDAALQAVARACAERGAEVEVVPTDVGSPAAVDELADRSLARFGTVDVWIQAAAMVIAGPIGEESPEEVARLVQTNVTGSYLAARRALSLFLGQGTRHLILVGSILGITPNPAVPAYVMSKYAVRGLAVTLQRAVAGLPHVDVSLVLPGPVDTPLFTRAANHSGRRLRAIPPAYDPERVAAAVVACVRRPRSQVTAGVVSRLVLAAHRLAPATVDRLVAAYAQRALLAGTPEPHHSGALFAAPEQGAIDGGWRHGKVRRALGTAWGRTLSRRGTPGTSDRRRALPSRLAVRSRSA